MYDTIRHFIGTGGTGRNTRQNGFSIVTSSNPKGGNLGGLTGADAVCQSLARAAGAGGKTWHAYLSTSTVDAKGRIGNGPWYNFKGQQIASNVADLHSANNKISAATALTEKSSTPNYLAGNPPAPASQPLQHDIMTGSNEDGTRTRTHARTGPSAMPTRRPCSATLIAWDATRA
jgi:hypothetical protein